MLTWRKETEKTGRMGRRVNPRTPGNSPQRTRTLLLKDGPGSGDDS